MSALPFVVDAQLFGKSNHMCEWNIVLSRGPKNLASSMIKAVFVDENNVRAWLFRAQDFATKNLEISSVFFGVPKQIMQFTWLFGHGDLSKLGTRCRRQIYHGELCGGAQCEHVFLAQCDGARFFQNWRWTKIGFPNRSSYLNGQIFCNDCVHDLDEKGNCLCLFEFDLVVIGLSLTSVVGLSTSVLERPWTRSDFVVQIAISVG